MKEKCRLDNKSWQNAMGNGQNKKMLIACCFLFSLFIFSCTEKNKNEETLNLDSPSQTSSAEDGHIYYCPMHPEIEQDHPGICPKPECMGMELVLKISDDILNVILKPVTSSVLSTVKTIKPVEKEVSLDFETPGFIDYDIRYQHSISTRYNGRIEKLYVKYNYQPVKIGDRVFDVYSPDLITAQENLVYLLDTDPTSNKLIEALKQKLSILDFTEKQIDELIRTKKVLYSVPVYSKWNGYIREMENQNAGFNTKGGGMASMGGGSQSENKNDVKQAASPAGSDNLQTPELSVREGMYINNGQTVFNVIDPGKIVAMLQIRVENLSKVQPGQEVELIVNDTSKIIRGTINFIEPFLKPGSKTLLARVEINNSGQGIKIGTLVNAKIKSEPTEGLFIPAKSVIDLGKEKIVWLKKDNHFIAKKIETGLIMNGWIEIYDGITEKDEIAEEAHYLNDSESFIKVEK